MFKVTIAIDDIVYMDEKVHSDNLHDALFGFAYESNLHSLVDLLCENHDQIVEGEAFQCSTDSISVDVELIY